MTSAPIAASTADYSVDLPDGGDYGLGCGDVYGLGYVFYLCACGDDDHGGGGSDVLYVSWVSHDGFDGDGQVCDL